MDKFEQQLLMILCEECGEVIQAISKGVRFGFDSKFKSDATNAEKVAFEMSDLIAVYEMLVERGILLETSELLKAKKKEKVVEMFNKFSK